MATWIVWARSWAEIPVVTPCAASIETVNAVLKGDSFLAAIRSSPSSSQRSGVSERQISPRPCMAMKLIASGVANCAARVRSPSFSRVSSSHTTTMRPRRMSSIASSMEEKTADCSAPAGSVAGLRLGISLPFQVPKALHEPLGVPRDQVHLDVYAASLVQLSERRPLERLGDQRYLEAFIGERGHGEAHAVHGNRSMFHHVAAQLLRQDHPDAAREPVLADREHLARPIHMPLHQMAAERVAGAKGRLEVDPGAVAELTEGRELEGLIHDVRLEAAVGGARRRQTGAADADRVPLCQLRRQLGAHAEAHPTPGPFERLDAADLLDDSGEHQLALVGF